MLIVLTASPSQRQASHDRRDHEAGRCRSDTASTLESMRPGVRQAEWRHVLRQRRFAKDPRSALWLVPN